MFLYVSIPMTIQSNKKINITEIIWILKINNNKEKR